MRAIKRYELSRSEKTKEIENNKEKITNEINNNYKITIQQSTKNKDRIIVISGLINDIYNSFDKIKDKQAFIKDNIILTNSSYISLKSLVI